MGGPGSIRVLRMPLRNRLACFQHAVVYLQAGAITHPSLHRYSQSVLRWVQREVQCIPVTACVTACVADVESLLHNAGIDWFQQGATSGAFMNIKPLMKAAM